MIETTEAMVRTAYDAARAASRRTTQAARLLLDAPAESKLEMRRGLEGAVAAETYAWNVFVAALWDSQQLETAATGPGR